MVKNPDLVFEKAEEMAEKYREQMMKKAEAEAAEAAGDDDTEYVEEEADFSATDEE
jgi:small subunit ribosomal protein S1